MSNEELYDAAVEAISKLFGDRSVSQAQAKENLRNLKGEIDVFIDSLGDDDES